MSDKINQLQAKWQKDQQNLPLTAELINALFEDTTDWQRSEEMFQQIQADVRNRSEVLARHVEFLLYHKQFQIAVSEAKTLCEVTNNHHLSLHYWALTNFLTGQFKPVLELADNLKLIPETKIIVARVLQRENRFEQGANLIKDTKSAEGLGLLSLLNLDLGQFDLAFANSEKAFQLKADQIDALQTKASLMVNEGKLVPGGRIVRKVLKLKPSSGRMLALQGEIEFFSLEIPTAIKSFERALDYMPEHLGCLHMLAWCYCIAGEFDVAELTFKKALAVEAEFAESLGALAVIAVIRNDLAGGEKMAADVLDKAPLCASALYAKELIAQQADSDAQPAPSQNNGFGDKIIAVVKKFKQ